MDRNLSVKRVMDSIVPISRFNRGEASKIFEEVGETGVKVVLKNNTPVGVIVEPGRYEKMIELLEDYALYFEAERRMKSTPAEGLHTQEEVMSSLGIGEDDLDDVDADID